MFKHVFIFIILSSFSFNAHSDTGDIISLIPIIADDIDLSAREWRIGGAVSDTEEGGGGGLYLYSKGDIEKVELMLIFTDQYTHGFIDWGWNLKPPRFEEAEPGEIKLSWNVIRVNGVTKAPGFDKNASSLEHWTASSEGRADVVLRQGETEDDSIRLFGVLGLGLGGTKGGFQTAYGPRYEMEDSYFGLKYGAGLEISQTVGASDNSPKVALLASYEAIQNLETSEYGFKNGDTVILRGSFIQGSDGSNFFVALEARRDRYDITFEDQNFDNLVQKYQPGQNLNSIIIGVGF